MPWRAAGRPKRILSYAALPGRSRRSIAPTCAFGSRSPNNRPAESPLTEAEQRRTFARVVLAALPPLVERTRTLCRQALDRDRDDSRSRRVILGQAAPGPTPPRPAQGTADAQDAARRDIHRGGHNY